MTPAVVLALRELERARIEEGSSLNRHAPKVAAAIDRVLREQRRGSR